MAKLSKKQIEELRHWLTFNGGVLEKEAPQGFMSTLKIDIAELYEFMVYAKFGDRVKKAHDKHFD